MDSLPDSTVNKIFMVLHGKVGNKFLNQYSTGFLDREKKDEGIENAKKVWGKALADLTANEITRGLKAVYTYIPDCDSFRLACRDYEADFAEAVHQMRLRADGKDEWSNPALFWAAAELGSDLSTYPYKSIANRWKLALDRANEDVKKGKRSTEIPKRRVTLPPPGRTTISQEKAAQIFAGIYDVLEKKVVRNG